MSSRALPVAVRTRLTQILAATERGLMAAESLRLTFTEGLPSGVISLTDQRAAEQLRLALVAAAHIIDAIGALDWPAADRQAAVEHWHDQVRQRCGIDRARFAAERRQQSWWDVWQQALERPVVVRRAAPAPRVTVPSFGQQLTRAIETNRVGVNWLVAETKHLQQPVNKRTIERLMADEQQPRIETIRALEAAFTTARHGVPFHFQRGTKRRAKRR